MVTNTLAVLRPGDWVHFDGSEYQVVAVAGTSVRLRSPARPDRKRLRIVPE